jgi:glycosyltransferase involved in cell wall biosynthesis
MKASVVIPVYNPGTYIDRCINSLLAQTMPADEFEVIFVDDGSTDDTPERLDRLAVEHPHMRVIHEENSGWPGKPRNVGVAAARGEYVQFVDQDDSLGPRALEKLYDIGARNHADIVLGKVTSDFRGVPHGVFRHNVEHCTIRDFPLIDSLTPHKMFRTAFLAENGIAYPEGKRRLEDQLYMVRTYLAADVVSIVGDYPCYFYMGRDDGKNAGSVPIDPAGYYTNLREILDVIIAKVEPGEFRDGLLRRFYRNELLSRLKEPASQAWEESYRTELFAQVRQTALAKFSDAVPDGMDAVPRIRSVLLREDRADDLTALDERLAGIRCRPLLSETSWGSDGLDLEITAAQWSDEDRPLLLAERDGRLFFDPALVAGCVPESVTDVTAELASVRADVVIRNRRTEVEWFVPAELTPRLVPSPEHGPDVRRLEFRGAAHVGPQLHDSHHLPRGTWDAYVRIHALGLVNRARLGSPDLVEAEPVEPAILGSPSHVAIPLFTEHGNITLDIDEHVRWLAGEVASRGSVDATDNDGEVRVVLPIRMSEGAAPWPARISLVIDRIADGPSITIPAEITGGRSGAVMVADFAVERIAGPVKQLRPGRYDMFLHSGTRGLPPVRVGTFTVSRPSPARRLATAARAAGRPLPRGVKRAILKRR